MKFPKAGNLRPEKLGKIRQKPGLKHGRLNFNVHADDKSVWRYNCTDNDCRSCRINLNWAEPSCTLRPKGESGKAKVRAEKDRGEAGPTKVSADINGDETKNYIGHQFFVEFNMKDWRKKIL
jgi:hypothetical protein